MLQSDAHLVQLPSGAALHVEGTRGRPGILFLHGVGGGAWSWKPQRFALASAYRLFAWEARGHGSAARVSDAGLADYYVDAQQALEVALQESGGAMFVAGHSMGGLLAIVLACDRPQAVKGLFLVDPVYSDGAGGAYGHFNPTAGRIARWFLEPLLRSFEHDGKMSRVVARSLFERAFEDRTLMEAAWLDQRTQIPVEYPRMLRESFDQPIGFQLRDFASEVRAPTLLLDAAEPGDDPRFPELAEKLRDRLGSDFAAESIPGGHYLQLDRPAEVTERLRRFAERYARVPVPYGIGGG